MIKLTPAEIGAAKKARYFGLGWGNTDGLDPAGMVAKERGLRFIRTISGGWVPHPEDEYDAATAMEDVAEWLRFESANEYLRIMEIEGAKIFNRARY